MADQGKQNPNTRAWHARQPYSEAEAVRLVKAAEIFRREATARAHGRAFELLDVGCGVGPLRAWLPGESFHITGVDLNAEAVELARQHYDDCRVGNVEQEWPFEDGRFDGVHAGAVLEHVVDWHAPLNQANRVLRDDGLLVVSVPNLRYWKEARRLLQGRQPHWMTDMRHLHAYTPKFLSQLVSLHGFEVKDLQADRLNLPLLPKRSAWLGRKLAAWGSVLILTARLARRVRAEHKDTAGQFARTRPLPLRSIEVLSPFSTRAKKETTQNGAP